MLYIHPWWGGMAAVKKRQLASAGAVEPHTVVLQNLFSGHLILSSGDAAFPAWSLDLTALDFFLLRHSQSRVFHYRPANLLELHNSICQALTDTSANIYHWTMSSMFWHAQKCLKQINGHFMDNLFHTLDVQWQCTYHGLYFHFRCITSFTRSAVFLFTVKIPNFPMAYTLRPVEAELFHTNGWMDRLT